MVFPHHHQREQPTAFMQGNGMGNPLPTVVNIHVEFRVSAATDTELGHRVEQTQEAQVDASGNQPAQWVME